VTSLWKVLIGLVLSVTLSFSTWAATSIYALKSQLAVQDVVNEQTAQTNAVQQATLATFQTILGDILADVRVIKAIMEERKQEGK
jgi:hypothetical protein